jgi:hypothetical protein
MVHVKAQQINSRLRSKVAVQKFSPAEVWAYDGVGDVEARETEARYPAVEFSSMPWNRRKISRRRFYLALPIDKMDDLAMLIKPDSVYVTAIVRAMERVYDRMVIGALFSNVYTGRDFETTVTAASDGVDTVNATSGLTYEKLLEIDQNFIDKEVGTDVPEPFTLGISGDEHTALMQELELTSGDYSRQYVAEKGRIQRAAGFDLVLFGGSVARPMLDVNTGTRDCFAMSNRGVCVAMSDAVQVSMDDRKDLVQTRQVVATFILGAVRTEGLLVQKVQTTAS